MSIFDKMSNMAKNVGEKALGAAKTAGEMASDAVEVAKLNSRINKENDAIDAAYKQIGKMYYDACVSDSSKNVIEGLQPVFEAIDAHKQTIASLEEQLEAVKKGTENAGAEDVEEKEATEEE